MSELKYILVFVDFLLSKCFVNLNYRCKVSFCGKIEFKRRVFLLACLIASLCHIITVSSLSFNYFQVISCVLLTRLTSTDLYYLSSGVSLLCSSLA